MINQRDRLCTGMLAVGVTGVFVFSVYIPRSAELGRLRGEYEALQNHMARRTKAMEGLAQVRTEAQRARRYLADFNQAVPNDSQIGRFVEDLASLAESREIRDPQVEPQQPLAGVYGEVLPVRLGFVGNFESILDFLKSIESMTRIARVTQLNLAQSEEQPGLLSADITVLIYYQSGDGGPPGQSGHVKDGSVES